MDRQVWSSALLVIIAIGGFFAMQRGAAWDRESAESQARYELQALREGVAKEKAAKQPLDTLQDPPDLWMTLLTNLPHEAGTGLILVSGRQPRDTGYWAFDRETDRVYIDCTHTDSRGNVWTAY